MRGRSPKRAGGSQTVPRYFLTEAGTRRIFPDIVIIILLSLNAAFRPVLAPSLTVRLKVLTQRLNSRGCNSHKSLKTLMRDFGAPRALRGPRKETAGRREGLGRFHPPLRP